MRKWVNHQTFCDYCDEELSIDVEIPYEAHDISVFGDVIVKQYEDRVEMSLEDWKRFRPQIVAALKQGDMKHATRSPETGNKENYAAAH